MNRMFNQAVVFTKPVHHLGLPLTPEQLAEKTQSFLTNKGFRVVRSRQRTGTELAAHDVIKQHYMMYSKASSIGHADELGLTDQAKTKFSTAFGKRWKDEVTAGRIMGNPGLLKKHSISANDLFLLWNACFTERQTQKIQDGVILAWLNELDCYCINAFYPAMEENFYHPKTNITYFVVEFDPAQISWQHFRKAILGSTDASKADPASFRGQLYAEYGSALEYPGRDNFVHGSAGPFEGFIERAIHEADFSMASNPVGQYLAARGVTLESFAKWKATRSISQLGGLFDATEEKNTQEALLELDSISF